MALGSSFTAEFGQILCIDTFLSSDSPGSTGPQVAGWWRPQGPQAPPYGMIIISGPPPSPHRIPSSLSSSSPSLSNVEFSFTERALTSPFLFLPSTSRRLRQPNDRHSLSPLKAEHASQMPVFRLPAASLFLPPPRSFINRTCDPVQ